MCDITLNLDGIMAFLVSAGMVILLVMALIVIWPVRHPDR